MIKNLFFFVMAAAFMASTATACKEVDGKLTEYQALFLTSGQVYYGKLTDSSGPFYAIEDVYYIRRDPSENEEEPPQLTLIKMGQELHGPEDKIMLNRDHILYIENIKPEGQVGQRISEAKAALAAAPTGQTGQTVPTPLPPNQLSPEEMEQFRKFQEFQRTQQAQQDEAPPQ